MSIGSAILAALGASSDAAATEAGLTATSDEASRAAQLDAEGEDSPGDIPTNTAPAVTGPLAHPLLTVQLGLNALTDAAGLTDGAAAGTFAEIETADNVRGGTVTEADAAAAAAAIAKASARDEEKLLASPGGLLAWLRKILVPAKWLVLAVAALVAVYLVSRLVRLLKD